MLSSSTAHVAGLVAQWTLRTGTCVNTWGCSTSLWCARSRAGEIFIAEAETVQGDSHPLQTPALPPPQCQCLFTGPSPAPSAPCSYLGVSPSPELPSASSEPPTIVCPQLHQLGMVTQSWHTELLPSGDVPSLDNPVPSMVQAPAVAQVAPKLCPDTVLTWVSLVSPHSPTLQLPAASCAVAAAAPAPPCQNPAHGEDMWPWVNLGGCRTQARQGGVFIVAPENG